MAPPIVGKLVAYAIGFAFLALLIAGIIILVQSASCKSGQSANLYEHFDASDDYLSNLQKRTTLVKKTIETIQSDMDILGDDADDTCNIMKIVEDAYISNNSAPTDESEYELSREVQQSRVEKRKERAKRNFQAQKDAFVESHQKKPLLECFAPSGDVEQAEQDLNDAVRELSLLLDSAEMKLATTKGEKTWLSLLFNAPFLKKAIDSTTPKTSENFDTVKGSDILSKADELIGKANTIHARFNVLREQVTAQKAVAGSLNKKANDLQKGKVSQSDVATATTY